MADKFGDLSRMDRLVANLGRLARVPSLAAASAASQIEALVQAEFDAGTDPYGEDWAELAEATKARGRSAPPLTDTGDMRDSFHATPMQGSGIALTIDHPAQIHQTGWSGVSGTGPARPVLPGKNFPPAWADVIGDAVAEFVNDTLQEAG